MRNHCVISGVLAIGIAATCIAKAADNQWCDDGRFHRAVADADRIMVWTWVRTKDGQLIEQNALQVAGSREVADIAHHIKFKSPQNVLHYFCHGSDLNIDWYRAGDKLLWSGLIAGHAFTWEDNECPGHVRLARESADWLVAWLAKNGVDGPKRRLAEFRLHEATQREARSVLRRYVPDWFLDALRRAKVDAESRSNDGFLEWQERRDKLRDEYIRVAVEDRKQVYRALFRLMGCLSMRWDRMYEPEQMEAFDFLVRAPRDELDVAIRAAVQSKDRAAGCGAARVVFCQHYMTLYGKKDCDISRWMGSLADAAYDSPFPGNRRLVLYRLMNDKKAPAFDVLERATADSDQTVRSRAIIGLRVRGGAEAFQILQRVATGAILPRPVKSLPTDFAKGADAGFVITEMAPENYGETDREAAAQALPLHYSEANKKIQSP